RPALAEQRARHHTSTACPIRPAVAVGARAATTARSDDPEPEARRPARVPGSGGAERHTMTTAPGGSAAADVNLGEEGFMLRKGFLLVLVVLAVGLFAQAASADPTNAKNSQPVTAICGGQQVQVAVNGNGVFTPAHVIGSTSVFIPTAFNL